MEDRGFDAFPSPCFLRIPFVALLITSFIKVLVSMTYNVFLFVFLIAGFVAGHYMYNRRVVAEEPEESGSCH